MAVVTKKKKATKKATEKDLCRLVTPEFRVSYPHVFKAHAPKPTDKKKYSITMLFPKDTAMIGLGPDGEERSIMKTIKNAKLQAFGPKEDWPEDLESPITDGDDPKFADKEGYAGHWVIKASSSEEQKPSVVYRTREIMTEQADLYPGCYARAYIFAYAWEYMGKQGIGFILDHVQKLRDGKSFGGKKPVEQVFAPLDDLEDEEDISEEEDF